MERRFEIQIRWDIDPWMLRKAVACQNRTNVSSFQNPMIETETENGIGEWAKKKMMNKKMMIKMKQSPIRELLSILEGEPGHREKGRHRH